MSLRERRNKKEIGEEEEKEKILKEREMKEIKNLEIEILKEALGVKKKLVKEN